MVVMKWGDLRLAESVLAITGIPAASEFEDKDKTLQKTDRDTRGGRRGCGGAGVTR